MPTTYTHDVFGLEVYRKLPEEIKGVIRRNKELFRIGLHGPDLLFYHLVNKKVNQTGVAMHRQQARAFFEENMEKVRRDRDEALLAYLLGFGCHYLLDSACHPFVNRMEEEGVISHTNLEKEYDRFLLKLNGKDPNHYYPLKRLPVKKSYAKTIHKALPMISERQLLVAWKLMKHATNLMVCDDGGLRKETGTLAFRGLRLKEAQKLMEHFMGKKEMHGSQKPIEELHKRYQAALCTAPQELEQLYRLAKEDISLSERWDRTYNG